MSEVDKQFGKILMPMIRKVVPSVIASQIVGVQPMSGPIGMIFSGSAMRSLRRYISDVTKRNHISIGDNEIAMAVIMFVKQNDEEGLKLAREANMALLLDNETFRIAADTFLRAHAELKEAWGAKYEGMSKNEVERFEADVQQKFDDYELIRRLVDEDNHYVHLISNNI